MKLFVFFFRENLDPKRMKRSPVVMKENRNYIREKKPITFTMADLTKDAEEINDEEFKIVNVYPTEQRSVLPKRNCTKRVVYYEDRHE